VFANVKGMVRTRVKVRDLAFERKETHGMIQKKMAQLGNRERYTAPFHPSDNTDDRRTERFLVRSNIFLLSFTSSSDYVTGVLFLEVNWTSCKSNNIQ
jgi:hypothetical protein